jgi:hypothetical protein
VLQSYARACLEADQGEFATSFDREPFGFTHNLHHLDLFESDSLRALAAKYVQRDYFVASGAPEPGSAFYSVAHGRHTPSEAMERLETGSARVLMKRPENYDPRFRELLEVLFRQILDMRGGLRGERVLRLDGSILVSSAATITPFHFDPEITFFFQVEGEKNYHLYSPSAISESELERFYVKGELNIGELGIDGRDPAREYVFALRPGIGMHQPQNSPHWVETCRSRSVSYVFSFETDATRAAGWTRSFNHYLRKAGMNPAPLGTRPSFDAMKAEAMHLIVPARKTIGRTLRGARDRLAGRRQGQSCELA